MDSKSLEILEFPRIREILAGFTSFPASYQLARELEPLTDYEPITRLLRQSAEARRLLSLEPDISLSEATDIGEAVRLAARGKVLEPKTLVDIQHTLFAISQLRRQLKKRSNEFPRLWESAAEIRELQQIEKSISRCLTPAGELMDSASPRLARLRHQLREVREQLLSRLEAIVRSPRGQRIAQEPIVTEREGRYVIPVKVEARKEMKGIVHDVSNTGATVFVEPWETVEMGNEFRELVMGERHEAERILGELSAAVGAYEMEISGNIILAAELDLALAKARYAARVNANEPVLATFDNAGTAKQTNGVLRLIDARHPLLGTDAVPISVEIGREYSVLVITGPNTGGKTVALKTIGLLSLMAQSGIPIPASPESTIPVCDSIFADIGDEQSIEQTLSTFSWHIGNISRITSGATRKSLVLLDELGTSTDPVEGSALARAVLSHFLARGTMTVATSHFSDLKAFAHVTPGIQNASLDFDPVTLTPTYHLTVGVPGGSNTLVTAARLGLPAEIIRGAREMLSEDSKKLETLLGDLGAEKEKLTSLRRDLETQKEAAAIKNTELESELIRLRAERRQVIQETRDHIVREAAELQRQIRQTAVELRREKAKDKVERARKVLATTQERLRSDIWQVPEGSGTEAEAESRLSVGDTVWLKDADLTATVLSVSEKTGQVEVQAGQTRLKLSRDRVAKAIPVTSRATPDFTLLRKEADMRPVPPELHLRGRRAEEIELLLDAYLNDASLANLSEVRIIHGIGTGTLKRVVHDLLVTHPLVKSFRPGGKGEGGDGATVIKL